jgi:glycosyltransferase involved in cell wall biosynthesis
MLNKKKTKITFIIRTKNEERWVGHAIQSVLDRVHRPEIIIVDNNSTDKTLKIVKYFMHDPQLNDESDHPSGKNYTDLKIVNIKNYTPGAALNYGIKKASNNTIVIMSAHCVLKKFDNKKISTSLKKYACIFGNQIPVWEGKKLTKRYIWSHFINKKVENMYSKLEDRFFIHNALAIYDKKILKKYPFDEKLLGKEDRYWAKKIVKNRLKFLYDPSLEAEHHYTDGGSTWKIEGKI